MADTPPTSYLTQRPPRGSLKPYVPPILFAVFQPLPPPDLPPCYDFDTYEDEGGVRAVRKLGSWKDGKLERWEVAKLRSWEVGKLRSWEVGMLQSWEVGKLRSWEVGMLQCWEVGKL